MQIKWMRVLRGYSIITEFFALPKICYKVFSFVSTRSARILKTYPILQLSIHLPLYVYISIILSLGILKSISQILK